MRRYRSTYKPRSLRRTENRNKAKLIWSVIISLFLLYVLFQWVIPLFIGQLSIFSKTSPKKVVKEEISLSPPVLNIPYEATNTATITIKGFSSPLSKVKIYLDNSLVSEINSEADGAFTSNPISLFEGVNNLHGKTTDDQGNESTPSKRIQVSYSNEKPDLEISEPEDNKEIKGGDKKVVVRGKTDPENEVTINGFRVILASDGSFSTEVGLSEGDNVINFTAKNEVGNFNSIEKRVKYVP